MFREQERHRQALGIWGPGARAWIDYEPPRAAGFPLALDGSRRVLGFPAGPPIRLRIRRRPRLKG